MRNKDGWLARARHGILARLLIVLSSLVAVSASAAQAEPRWLEATTRNFVIYSWGSESGLRETAANLEKFDFTLRFLSGTPAQARARTKLKVYLLRDIRAVSESAGYSGGLAGYYAASARGAMLASTRLGTGNNGDDATGQDILFHEYAHHFMFQYFPATYPAWYSEGFADFVASTRILPNDAVEVGHAAGFHYRAFYGNEWIPLRRLITTKDPADLGNKSGLIYSQGWLLVHYLSTNKARAGQLGRFLAGINAGQDYGSVADAVFGDGVKELDAELHAYQRRNSVDALRIPFKPIDVGPIAIRPLRPAEIGLMLDDIALTRGLPAKRAPLLAGGMRQRAAAFPQDAHALAILTEAERVAGNVGASTAALGRWLALAPNAPRALMYQGLLQADALKAAKSNDNAAWEAARAQIFEAHKAAPSDPLILEAYFDSFALQGAPVTPGGQNAIFRAHRLAPQVYGLRYKVAADFEQRGMIDEAISVIRPVAYQAHEPRGDKDDQPEAERAPGTPERPRQMLERLERKRAATAAGGR